MADGEASGEQRLDDPVESPSDAELGVGGHDDYQFDAFDATSWQFTPAPLPWHRTLPAMLGFVAVGLALVVLVVAVALLARRSEDAVPARSATTESPVPTSATTPTTTATMTASSTPSPAPVDTGDAPAPAAPPRAPSDGVPRSESTSTKKPEFNVTRTPISVRPPARGSSR